MNRRNTRRATRVAEALQTEISIPGYSSYELYSTKVNNNLSREQPREEPPPPYPGNTSTVQSAI